MILDMLSNLKDVCLILFGAIISIATTWIAIKQQHKMSLRQLAVQNKLDTSRMAIGRLMEVKGELSISIWYLDHHQKLGDGMLEEFAKRAAKLASFEREAPNYINAIESIVR